MRLGARGFTHFNSFSCTFFTFYPHQVIDLSRFYVYSATPM
jgi:hypothetical protein